MEVQVGRVQAKVGDLLEASRQDLGLDGSQAAGGGKETRADHGGVRLVGAQNLLEELLAEHVWSTGGVPGYKRNASRQEILADATVPATWSDEPL